MLKKILFLLVLFVSGLSYGQIQNSATFNEAVQPEWEGTFQVILANERMIEPGITTDLLQQIEDKREQNETIFWEYSSYITIQILSKELVLSNNYKPLKTYGYEE